MSTHSSEQKLRESVASLLDAGNTISSREDYLDRLIHLHEECRLLELEQPAERLREAFLLALDDGPSVTQEPRYCQFLTEQIEPSDFSKLTWQSPARVAKYCGILYGIQFSSDEAADRIRQHVASVLEVALHLFEERGDYERMLHLVQTAPTSPALVGGELLRLRNRVHLYEMSRVRRNKRILYAYLALQAVFVTVIFPLLFVYAENGVIRDAVKEATDVEIPEKGSRQYLRYTDGLYWSIITATSIGYGDVTPRSDEGRVIAAVLGTMGVITIGVVAGLILNWITPRRLD